MPAFGQTCKYGCIMFRVHWFSFHLGLEAIATDSGWLYCKCCYLAIYWKFFWMSSSLYSLQFQVVSCFISSSLKLHEFPVMTYINFQKAVSYWYIYMNDTNPDSKVPEPFSKCILLQRTLLSCIMLYNFKNYFLESGFVKP